MKKKNEYASAMSVDLYERTPKAVFAAIAVSMLTAGGDYLREDGTNGVDARIVNEWRILHENGIVPQVPPMAKGRTR